MEKKNDNASNKKPSGHRRRPRKGKAIPDNKPIFTEDDFPKLPSQLSQASERKPGEALTKGTFTRSKPSRYRERIAPPKDESVPEEQLLENPHQQEAPVRPTHCAPKEKPDVFVVQSRPRPRPRPPMKENTDVFVVRSSSPQAFQSPRNKYAWADSELDVVKARPDSADYVKKFIPPVDSEDEVDTSLRPKESEAGCRKKDLLYKKTDVAHRKKGRNRKDKLADQPSNSDQTNNIPKIKTAWEEKACKRGKKKVRVSSGFDCHKTRYDSDDTQFGIASLPDQDIASSPNASIDVDYNPTLAATTRMATLEELGGGILSNPLFADLERDNINASVLIGNIYPPDALSEETEGAWTINDLVHSLCRLSSLAPNAIIPRKYFKK